MSRRVPVWKEAHRIATVLSLVRSRWISILLAFLAAVGFYLPAWMFRHGHHFPVGVYVTVMGVVIAAMAAMPHEPEGSRALWMLFIILLGVAEIRSIYVENSEQMLQFQKISHDLDLTAQGLKETAAGIRDSVSRMNELWNETTGSNSYMYFEISFVGGPLGIDVPGEPSQKKGMMIVGTIPVFVGQYPLHNVYLFTVGPGSRSTIDYGTVFPRELGRPRPSPELSFWPDKNEQNFFFFINTSNGSYEEMILIKKFGPKWLWAYRFYKYGVTKPLRLWAAPGFPKNELRNWGRQK